jgi:SWI/SNF-related matrix-associated actin-dependent regulator 1 of chromatin subfamily A
MTSTEAKYNDILNALKQEEYVIGALITIYNGQKMDEINRHTATYQNNIRFNKFDAGILTSIAQQYLNKGFLTIKQINLVRNKIKKYSQQLSSVEVPLLKNNFIDRTKEEKNPPQLKLDEGRKIFLLSFPYNPELIAKIKTIPKQERSWNSESKKWQIKATSINLQLLKEWDIPISEDIERKFSLEPKRTIKIDSIPGLKKEPFPFQKEGIEFIEKREGRALIGDDMGLGKTLQSLGWLQYKGKDALPAVIVVPSYLKLNWKKEIQESTSFTKVVVINGGFKKESIPPSDTEIYIVNYDIIEDRFKKSKKNSPDQKPEIISKGWKEFFIQLKAKTLIFDECHFLKDRKTKRTHAAVYMSKYFQNVIGLSGTPITNRPEEFWTIINMIDENLFPKFMSYAFRYCNARKTPWGWDTKGASNTTELNQILTNSIMIRRLKTEVLKQLPPKRRIRVPFNLTNKLEYDKAEKNFIKYLLNTKGREKAEKAQQAETLVQIEELKQLSVKGKMKACIEWIQNFIESEQKLVIFCHHSSTINQIQEAFPNISVKVNKDTSNEKRQECVELFQKNPDIKLFIAGIRSGGTGLTLTAASNVAFMELDWTPGAHDQAEDRIHRIGQAEECTIYYLISENTIEEQMIDIIETKRRVLSKILNGEDITDHSMFDDLISYYTGGKKK